jgi:hypothetical protein
MEQFLTHHTMTKRGDKSIYIRPEYHERLSRIIQIIADDQIPLYAYLDNILAYHFEMFEKGSLMISIKNTVPFFNIILWKK